MLVVSLLNTPAPKKQVSGGWGHFSGRECNPNSVCATLIANIGSNRTRLNGLMA
jgi:hypothetical protein